MTATYGPVSFTSLVTSEIRKVTSLKFWWLLLIAPVVIGALASMIFGALADDAVEQGLDTGSTVFVAVGLYLTIATNLLFVSVFGAINAAGETRHRTLATTFLIGGNRSAIIGAKYLVTAVIGFVYALVTQMVSVVVMLIFGIGNFEVTDTIVSIFLVGLVLAPIWSLIGGGLGLLLGSPVSASLALILWVPFGEGFTRVLLDQANVAFLAKPLPAAATVAVLGVGRIREPDAVLSFGVGLAVVAMWAAVFGAAGWWRTTRRDII